MQALLAVLDVCVRSDGDSAHATFPHEHPFTSRVRQAAFGLLSSNGGGASSREELSRHILAAALGVPLDQVEAAFASVSPSIALAALPLTSPVPNAADVTADGPPPTLSSTPTPVALPRGFSTLQDGRAADTRVTHQTCFVSGDEGEVCVYEGLFCYDGHGPIAVVAEPGQYAMHASDPSGSFPDPSSACMDYRFGEISSWAYSSCRYDGSGARDYYGVLYDPQRLRGIDDSGSGTGAHGRRLAWPHPDDAVRAVAAGADGIPPVPPNYVSAVHTPVDYTTRTLGPHNRRDVHLRVLPPSAVWPDPHLGWPSVAAAVPNAIPHEGYPSLRVRRYTLPAASESAPRPAGYPDSIDFIEGDGSAGGSGLWVAALPGQVSRRQLRMNAAARARCRSPQTRANEGTIRLPARLRAHTYFSGLVALTPPRLPSPVPRPPLPLPCRRATTRS